MKGAGNPRAFGIQVLRTTLEITDEVNVRFKNLDIATRQKMVKELKYFMQFARHTPSYKLGRWDGTVSYCDMGGRTSVNLLERVLPIILKEGYFVDIDDKRKPYKFSFDSIDENSYSHVTWPEGHPCEGEPIVLKEHQVSLVNGVLTKFQCVNVAPTASGKTIVCAILSEKVEKYGRTVIIVPTKDLVTQTEEDYINLGLDVGAYYGDRKELDKTHTICTWQSIDYLLRNNKQETLDALTKDVVAIIGDECHKFKANELRKIMTTVFNHCPIRWGFTGTLPPEEYEQVALFASLGPLNAVQTAVELQRAGVLAKLQINVKQLDDVIKAPVHGDYQSELLWLTTNKKRVDAMAVLIKDVAKGGNTLVLVDRIKSGEMLADLIPDSVFISGKVKSTKRREEYKAIQTTDNKVIIATYGVASTGININRLFNLVLIEPGKSFVRVIQSIGRGLRVAEDKDSVNVLDIASNCKFAKRHLTKRKRFYKDSEYPFLLEKVTY